MRCPIRATLWGCCTRGRWQRSIGVGHAQGAHLCRPHSGSKQLVAARAACACGPLTGVPTLDHADAALPRQQVVVKLVSAVAQRGHHTLAGDHDTPRWRIRRRCSRCRHSAPLPAWQPCRHLPKAGCGSRGRYAQHATSVIGRRDRTQPAANERPGAPSAVHRLARPPALPVGCRLPRALPCCSRPAI